MTQSIINQAHKSLIKSGKTIAVAESCTGGILSSMLTELSGSSKYFVLGVVTYSNRVKHSVLAIPSSIISKKGAVSEEVAKLMAQNVRKLAKADMGIGITGIAGPTGATARKPVGTVFIALAGKNKTICKKFHFSGNRIKIRKLSALSALKLQRHFPM